MHSIHFQDKRGIAALWLAACPSFGPAFAKSSSENGEDLFYVHAGNFAQHLLTLHRSGKCDEFPAIAAFIERLHTEGDGETGTFATIGILEAIQNVWSNADISPDEFLPFLQPASVAAWHTLNQFWAGKIPFVPCPSQHAASDCDS